MLPPTRARLHFNATERAFDGVRVIEIPTPRWTDLDAKYLDLRMPEGTKMKLSDRARPSPPWYAPVT